MEDTTAAQAESERIEVVNGDVTLVGDRWLPSGPSRGDVLLLHGGAQRRFSWRKTGERLARNGWGAAAFDARGHGDSSWAPSGDYSTAASLRDVLTLIDALPTRPVLVGASMGGMHSLQVAGEHPGIARALVLVDIVARPDPKGTSRILSFMNSAPNGFASLEEAADAIAAYNPHRPRPSSLDGLKKNLRLHEDGRWHWHWDPAMFGHFRGDAARLGGEEAVAAQAAQPAQADRRAEGGERANALVEAAKKVDIPVLLVRGGSSDVVSEEGLREMQELVPHAEVAEVAQTGHMIAGDDNDVFTARLGDFLDRLPAEG